MIRRKPSADSMTKDVEAAFKQASGILISPFFYDLNLYTEKIMFKMKHSIPEDSIRKVKNVVIKIKKNE